MVGDCVVGDFVVGGLVGTLVGALVGGVGDFVGGSVVGGLSLKKQAVSSPIVTSNLSPSILFFYLAFKSSKVV